MRRDAQSNFRATQCNARRGLTCSVTVSKRRQGRTVGVRRRTRRRSIDLCCSSLASVGEARQRPRRTRRALRRDYGVNRRQTWRSRTRARRARRRRGSETINISARVRADSARAAMQPIVAARDSRSAARRCNDNDRPTPPCALPRRASRRRRSRTNRALSRSTGFVPIENAEDLRVGNSIDVADDRFAAIACRAYCRDTAPRSYSRPRVVAGPSNAPCGATTCAIGMSTNGRNVP